MEDRTKPNPDWTEQDYAGEAWIVPDGKVHIGPKPIKPKREPFPWNWLKVLVSGQKRRGWSGKGKEYWEK